MSSPITSLPLGGNAQLVAQLLENGAPYVAPAGVAPYTFSPSASSDDPDVTITPATADVTGGQVPLAQQFLITDSASDTVGTPDDITVTASKVPEPATLSFLALGMAALMGLRRASRCPFAVSWWRAARTHGRRCRSRSDWRRTGARNSSTPARRAREWADCCWSSVCCSRSAVLRS